MSMTRCSDMRIVHKRTCFSPILECKKCKPIFEKICLSSLNKQLGPFPLPDSGPAQPSPDVSSARANSWLTGQNLEKPCGLCRVFVKPPKRRKEERAANAMASRFLLRGAASAASRSARGNRVSSAQIHRVPLMDPPTGAFARLGSISAATQVCPSVPLCPLVIFLC
jgi:hypothetical protein